MSVTLVCVNYQSDEETLRYLRSLAALRNARDLLNVVVVDNSGSAGGFTIPEDLFPGRVRVVRPSENLGYFGGAAFGVRAAATCSPDPDFLVISNVDLTIEQEDFLEVLHEDRRADVGIIAPSIRSNLTGLLQNPYMRRRPSSATMRRYVGLYSHYRFAASYERLSRFWRHVRFALGRRAAEPGAAADIYAPHGSFVVFTRAFFERGCELEYGAFLFNEEIHVAEQARRAGLKVRFRPDLRVRHEEHVVVGKYRNRAMVSYAREAAVFCYERYFRDAAPPPRGE